jgi:hypothetical protein
MASSMTAVSAPCVPESHARPSRTLPTCRGWRRHVPACLCRHMRSCLPESNTHPANRAPTLTACMCASTLPPLARRSTFSVSLCLACPCMLRRAQRASTRRRHSADHPVQRDEHWTQRARCERHPNPRVRESAAILWPLPPTSDTCSR